ncbi:hypothetical protein K440DRAFT_665385 [Wilcoxina mikolae CBS 423.85]|nr:hypothetical protein K440DRAFT_665385 [Wilcoxina mikolae CBS 423.85]
MARAPDETSVIILTITAELTKRGLKSSQDFSPAAEHMCSSFPFGGETHQLTPTNALAAHSQEPIDTVLSEGRSSTPPLMAMSQAPKTPPHTPFVLEGYTGRNIRYSSPLSAIRDSDAFVEWWEAYILRRSYEYGNLDTLAQEQSPSTPSPINNWSNTPATYRAASPTLMGSVTEDAESPASGTITAVGDPIEQSDTSRTAGFPLTTAVAKIKTSEQSDTGHCIAPADRGVSGDEIFKDSSASATSLTLITSVTDDPGPQGSGTEPVGTPTVVRAPIEQSVTSHNTGFLMTTTIAKINNPEQPTTGLCAPRFGEAIIDMGPDVPGEGIPEDSGAPATSPTLVNSATNDPSPPQPSKTIEQPSNTHAAVSPLSTVSTIQTSNPTSSGLCMPVPGDVATNLGRDIGGESPKDAASGTSVAQNDRLAVDSPVEGSTNLESSISRTDDDDLKDDAYLNAVTAIAESTIHTPSATPIGLDAVVENSEPSIITTSLKANEGFHTSVAPNPGVFVASGTEDSYPDPPCKILTPPGAAADKFNPVKSACGTATSFKADETPIFITPSKILAVVIEKPSHAKAAVNLFTGTEGC